MLILRRKSGESIVIGDNIVVTALDINEGSVRLAIDAPKEIPILRSELLQAADTNRDSAVTERSQSRDLIRFLGGKFGPERSRPKAVRPGSANWRSVTRTASVTESQTGESGTVTESQTGESGTVTESQTGKPGTVTESQTGESG